ncbi:MAG: alpha-L-fucosidase [Planctomycetes bacterium]|nr:alpha-L-fucosidase [Planctomycetota bacterium]
MEVSAMSFAIIVTLGLAGAGEARYEPKWESLDARPCPSWFQDAKFGIFIHWGVYAVPGYAPKGQYAEWYWNHITGGRRAANDPKRSESWRYHVRTYGEDFRYQDFAPLFKAELFDPDQWAATFARAGAKYVVITSKHHDGFCIFPSAEANRSWGQPWNSADIGPKRDLLGDLSAAVRAKGLKMGFYYSLYEWYNPLWLSDRTTYIEKHMIPQFKDVVTRYRPSIIFSDGEWDLPSSAWKSEELLAWLFNETDVRDEVVVNDRWGKDSRHKHGDYYTTEYASGMKDASHPWEENRGMGHSYGYNRNEALADYRTSRELLLMLVDLVSRGGNLLLDIGPEADGRIPVIMEERLLQIGAWLERNGEAIYGTRPAKKSHQWSEGKKPQIQYGGQYMVKYDLGEVTGDPKDGSAVIDAFLTSKPGVLYAIAPRWPKGDLVLTDVAPAAAATVTLLGASEPLKWRRTEGGMAIEIPACIPGDAPPEKIFAFEVAGVE